MERRLILAITLSLLVLIIWSSFMGKPSGPRQPLISSEKEAAVKTAPAKYQIEPESPHASLLNFSDAKFEIVFIEPQAAIKEVTFKRYQAYKFPLKYGFLLGTPDLTFQKQSVSKESVSFVHQDQEKRIIKRFIFPNSNYTIELEVEIQNISPLAIKIDLPLVLGVLDFSRPPDIARYQDVTLALKDKTLHLNGRKEMLFNEVKFLGVRDRYFCSIIESPQDTYTAFIKKIDPKESEIGLATKEISISPGHLMKQKFHIYLGPQELKQITQINPEWAAVMYYGTFDFISQMLLQGLEFLYRAVHNWGWAIIILSLVIYAILFPLTLKQMRSMKEMQVLQPRVEELRKAYKDNPQRLNKEIMELYRQHKVNPLGGCLPMILQIPIFFALYQALIRSIALKGATFLWIKDLSEPDRLFILPVSLPILGNEINILPILMTIGMFIQQKISAVAATSSSQEQQKIMMIIFPLMFGLIFYRMPAGLVLYWFINSTLMLIYQFRISRVK